MGKNCDKEIIEKTKNAIMDSLQTVIESLKLLDNVHVMKSLPIGLMNMVKGKLKELKDETKGIGAAQKLQIDAFDMVLKNDNDFKLSSIFCCHFPKKIFVLGIFTDNNISSHILRF